ncbi:MAG: apolipoprotein N-acyltransferase [Kiritimatiellia bacterium]
MPGTARAAAAGASGLMLASAFPPMSSTEAAWLGLVPLLLAARYSRPAVSFRWGWISGMVFWLMSLSWMLRLCRTGGPAALVIPGWILLSAYCALYTGAFCMLVCSVWRRLAPGRMKTEAGEDPEDRTEKKSFFGRLPGPGGLAVVAVTPLIWVGLEYLRSSLFTGFPWNALGVSQYRNLALIQNAEWGGVYAVSALVVLVNAALAATVLRFVEVYVYNRPARFQVELLAGLAVFLACWAWGVRTVRGLSDEISDPGVEVAAVQPAVPQLKKWPEGYSSFIFDRLRILTEYAAAAGPDLVVWPETAVPFPVKSDPQTAEFAAGLAGLGSPILAGSLEETERSGAAYFNSSVLVDERGRFAQTYRKRHLVPFGEYIPFEKYIPFLSGLAPLGFSCEAGSEATVFRISSGHGGRTAFFSVLICFEDVFSPLAREGVLNGARFLVNQTNDAWFDGSSGAVQHMAHCVFRCVENRVPAVRAANTGVTCFIDRTGRIQGRRRLKRSGWGMGEARFEKSLVAIDEEKSFTAYTRYGDITFALPCGLGCLAALGVAAVRRMKAAQCQKFHENG